MDFKIDTNIPYTKGIAGTRAFLNLYPIKQLKIGHSFLIPYKPEHDNESLKLAFYNAIHQQLNRYNREHENEGHILRCSKRKPIKHGEYGIRVWKLKKEN